MSYNYLAMTCNIDVFSPRPPPAWRGAHLASQRPLSLLCI